MGLCHIFVPMGPAIKEHLMTRGFNLNGQNTGKYRGSQGDAGALDNGSSKLTHQTPPGLSVW
eukprot:CAMPEP_0172444812 /NCGR_PEP_ID=MMETSP1065-20121228/4818_1 /TAXON_ID=265537 /ORGANISM="Amphiprora paludosa, Strain CCMP125" /LENGTH=61 /DNA_ID=CAMNT_0013195513 /DNA_START=75 /DNA_END=260 /DNA_ORIENTATION=-